MTALILFMPNRIFREGLRQILSDYDEFKSVQTCVDIPSLRALGVLPRGGVILVDISGGPPAAGERDPIAETYLEAHGRPIVALSLEGRDEEVLASVEAGAAAFVTRSDSIDDLVRVIDAAARGEFRCSPRIARLMQERLVELAAARVRDSRVDRLSQRERHILDLLGERMSNKQIARQLGLEVSTIKNHVHNIIVKLSVRNRGEAATLCSQPAAGTGG